MSKVKSMDELNALQKEILESKQEQYKDKVVINVSLATCSIAAGGQKALEALKNAVATYAAESILPQVEFVSSGCMTFCYAEPTVIVSVPGREPVTFGWVDEEKAQHIVNDFIAKGEDVDGVIPVNYERTVL